MATGTVKWFDQQKGFGFIIPDQGGKDVFVHIKQVQDSGLETLRQDDKVTYEVKADTRNPNRVSAHNLKPA